MTQGENLSLQVSTYSERTSERPQQRKQDGHHRFGRLHGIARKFKGIEADRFFGRDKGQACSGLLFQTCVPRLKLSLGRFFLGRECRKVRMSGVIAASGSHPRNQSTAWLAVASRSMSAMAMSQQLRPDARGTPGTFAYCWSSSLRHNFRPGAPSARAPRGADSRETLVAWPMSPVMIGLPGTVS
jgi:hypothetical protein